MVRGREIAPIRIALGGIPKETVVDAVRMLVERDENLRGIINVRRFYEMFVIGRNEADAVDEQFAGITDKTVHRNAARALGPASGALFLAQIFVRGTFVDVFGFAGINGKLRVG